MEQRDDLGVCADDVAAVVGTADRGPAQFGVQRIGVGAVGVVEDLIKDTGRCHGDPSGTCGLGTASAPPTDELSVPPARIVAGYHDSCLLDECGLIGDLR